MEFGIFMPRPYRDLPDLTAMLDLLMAGRAANTEAYYAHPGDVQWWLYYADPALSFPENIWLWDEADGLRAWVLFSPDHAVFDLFVQPSLLDTPEAHAMHHWAEAHFATQMKARGQNQVGVTGIAETDRARRIFLHDHGYRVAPDLVHFTRPLGQPLPSVVLPDGFTVRPCAGEPEIENRAQPQYNAFKSKWPWQRYLNRWRRFMHSPAYSTERDLVVVAPDDRLAAFAIHWPDPVNRVGLFEPVGTHPDFHGQGLGKAVLSASLQQMQTAGMTTAIVSTNHDNPAAIRLYESIGFQLLYRLDHFTKAI